MFVLLEILISHHLLPALLLDILSVSLDVLSRLITNFMQNILGFGSAVSSPIDPVYLYTYSFLSHSVRTSAAQRLSLNNIEMNINYGRYIIYL